MSNCSFANQDPQYRMKWCAKDRVMNGKTYRIDRITIHQEWGESTPDHLVYYLNEKTGASCNYSIDKTGGITLNVDESQRSYCSSWPLNDVRAITIECATSTNDAAGNKCTDAVLNSIVKLCIDICKRNGLKKMYYDYNLVPFHRIREDDPYTYEERQANGTACDNKNASLGTSVGLFTLHEYFWNKNCPGSYLKSKMSSICQQVNKALASSGQTYGSTSTIKTTNTKKELVQGVMGSYIGKSITVGDYLKYWEATGKKPGSANITIRYKEKYKVPDGSGLTSYNYKTIVNTGATYQTLFVQTDSNGNRLDIIETDYVGPAGPVVSGSASLYVILTQVESGSTTSSYGYNTVNTSYLKRYKTYSDVKYTKDGDVAYIEEDGTFWVISKTGDVTEPTSYQNQSSPSGGGGGGYTPTTASDRQSSTSTTSESDVFKNNNIVVDSTPKSVGVYGDTYTKTWDCYATIFHGNEMRTYYLPVIPQEVSESTSAEFSPVSMFGRSVKYQVYSGSSRSLSFTLDLHEELVENNYNYIHQLVAAFQSACYPRYNSGSVTPPEILVNIGKQFRIKGILGDCGATWSPPIINNKFIHCNLSLSVEETTGPYDDIYIRDNLSMRGN